MMPKLITLLTGNKIGAAGATQLADALQRNSTLTKLEIRGKHDMICAVIFIIFYLFSSSFYVIVSHMGCYITPFHFHCFTRVLLIIIFRDASADCIKGTKLELLEPRSWLMRFNATALSLLLVV